MDIIAHLSHENLDLARYELETLSGSSIQEITPPLVRCASNRHFHHRIAYAKWIGQHLFTCMPEELLHTLQTFEFRPHVTGTWHLTCCGFSNEELKEFAETIGSRIANTASMKSAETTLHLVQVKEKVFCAKILDQIHTDYLSRRAHLRASPHPSSLHPRFARALVNLTGVPDDGILIDPMCGAGGFLIEAGLLGIPFKGYDYDPTMIRRARRNLKQFTLATHVKQADATRLAKELPYVVVDLPYGKGSKKSKELDELYAQFIQMLDSHLIQRAVVVYPNFFDLTRNIRLCKHLHILRFFKHYVNKLLTRCIVVLESRK